MKALISFRANKFNLKFITGVRTCEPSNFEGSDHMKLIVNLNHNKENQRDYHITDYNFFARKKKCKIGIVKVQIFDEDVMLSCHHHIFVLEKENKKISIVLDADFFSSVSDTSSGSEDSNFGDVKFKVSYSDTMKIFQASTWENKESKKGLN